jgi:hypothetical protein
MFASEAAELVFDGMPEQPLCTLSLTVAIFAINLRPLASPVEEGELNELFVKRKSSQA